MNGKRVWLYCRVASRENSVELLAVQKQILEDYAKEHGLEIVGCSSDVGSGLTMNRPGLIEFHAAMEGGKVDILLLAKLSRLGRDLEEVLQYWRLLQKHHIHLYTATEGEIYLDMQSLFTEMFRYNFSASFRHKHSSKKL